jgi:hypothetical protein
MYLNYQSQMIVKRILYEPKTHFVKVEDQVELADILEGPIKGFHEDLSPSADDPSAPLFASNTP